ncbi:MAG: hypothetical protein ACPICH_00035 [Poseidonia sp.]|jgi:hypothetical protein
MLGADVIDTATPQTTSLGDKNRVRSRGFHRQQDWRLQYEGLFLNTVSQCHGFDTFNLALLSSQTPTSPLASKSTT